MNINRLCKELFANKFKKKEKEQKKRNYGADRTKMSCEYSACLHLALAKNQSLCCSTAKNPPVTFKMEWILFFIMVAFINCLPPCYLLLTVSSLPLNLLSSCVGA